MRRVAANIILCRAGRMVKNAMVEIREGKVSAIVPLDQYSNEPAATPFYNGVITHDAEGTQVGDCLMDNYDLGIEVGDEVDHLVLWTRVSLTDMIVDDNTMRLEI